MLITRSRQKVSISLFSLSLSTYICRERQEMCTIYIYIYISTCLPASVSLPVSLSLAILGPLSPFQSFFACNCFFFHLAHNATFFFSNDRWHASRRSHCTRSGAGAHFCASKRSFFCWYIPDRAGICCFQCFGYSCCYYFLRTRTLFLAFRFVCVHFVLFSPSHRDWTKLSTNASLRLG